MVSMSVNTPWSFGFKRLGNPGYRRRGIGLNDLGCVCRSHNIKTHNSRREQHLSSGYSVIFCWYTLVTHMAIFFTNHQPKRRCRQSRHCLKNMTKSLRCQSVWLSSWRTCQSMTEDAVAMRGFTSVNAKVCVIPLVLHLRYSINYTRKGIQTVIKTFELY